MKRIITLVSAVFLASCAHLPPVERDESRGSAPHDTFEALLDDLLWDALYRVRSDDGPFGKHLQDPEVVLVNRQDSIPWPAGYAPRTFGSYRVASEAAYVYPESSQLDKVPPKLGIRLDLLCVNEAIVDGAESLLVTKGPIAITVFNVGGRHGGGVPLDGLSLHYLPVFKNGRWDVVYRRAQRGERTTQTPASVSLTDLLDALLLNLLTANGEGDLSNEDFYGTFGNRDLVLVNTGHGIPWPDDYAPKNLSGWRLIADWKLSEKRRTALRDGDRKIGVRIDLLCVNSSLLGSEREFIFSGPIQLCIFNAGGNPDGVGRIGGCYYYYSAELKDGKWVVKCRGAFDP